MQMTTFLDSVRREAPGRVITPEELELLAETEPYLSARIRAYRALMRIEEEVISTTLESTFKRYDFSTGRGGLGQAKCGRDVTTVYRYCAFAMLADDLPMLENKLLFWLRTILQSLSFPGGKGCLGFYYGLMRKETIRRLPREDGELIDPFLKATEEILSS